MNTDRFSDQRNQQGNKGRSKKKLTKSVKGRRRSSSVKLAGTEMEGTEIHPQKKVILLCLKTMITLRYLWIWRVTQQVHIPWMIHSKGVNLRLMV